MEKNGEFMSDDLRGVVVHITSGDAGDWRQAFRNLSNLYSNESVPTPPGMVTVVVNGEAVRFTRAASPEADQLTRIVDSGIQIRVCINSVDRLGYDSGNLAEGIEPVASGVAEVVQLQQKNDAYLKLP